MSFYNCHIHVFSAQCIPKRFLQVGLPAIAHPVAGGIKDLLETRIGRWISFQLAKIKWAPFKVGARYASFASVGTMSSQQMVFENILQYYPEGSRFVVLSLNMDYMGAGPSELTYQGQIDQIIQIRRFYPDRCLPFLSIDPRMGTGSDILSFIEKYVGQGLPFIGIKIYPALGFFPFDNRLKKMYAFCEELEVPIITHCTPTGAFFLGKLNAAMGMPEPITYTDEKGESHKPMLLLPHHFRTNNNDKECDVFLQPENWSTVLAKYPKLKVCFAHMGGVGEIFKKSKPNMPSSWYEDLKSLMATYENVYTDVSYTLYNKKAWQEIKNFLEGTIISTVVPWRNNYGREMNFLETMKDRIVFGTDYFMTEQEDTEANLSINLPHWLIKQNNSLYEQITMKNPERFLKSQVYIP